MVHFQLIKCLKPINHRFEEFKDRNSNPNILKNKSERNVKINKLYPDSIYSFHYNDYMKRKYMQRRIITGFKIINKLDNGFISTNIYDSGGLVDRKLTWSITRNHNKEIHVLPLKSIKHHNSVYFRKDEFPSFNGYGHGINNGAHYFYR